MLRHVLRSSARPFVLVLLVLTTVIAGVEPASASASGDLVSYTNSARADHGVHGLAVASDLTRLAQEHASWMASHRSLEHTSGLGGKVCCWQKVGENVGYGASARAIFNAFMGSSSHRANILSSSYTQIGVGAARASDGYLYVDQIFRLPNGATPPASSPSPRRASRSSTRAPLHVVRSQPHIVLSARQLHVGRMAFRGKAYLKPVSDPLGRSVRWVRAMAWVTSR